MAVESLPAIAWSLTCPDTTTLVRASAVQFGAFAQDIPDNCTSIIVYNSHDTNAVFVKFGDPALVSAPQMTINNSTLLPALSSITFEVGVVGIRPILASATEDTIGDLFLLPEAGTDLIINITCIQGRPSANI